MTTRERQAVASKLSAATDREILRAGWRAIDKFLREPREEALATQNNAGKSNQHIAI